MAPNNVLPIYGNEKTMNLNPLVLANIQASPYFKVHLYELKTYHQVIDEIFYKVNHLEPWEKGSRKVAGQTGMCGGVRGVGTGGIVSSAFCLLYKLYTLKLTRKQVVSTCSHVDSPFIRALGLLYIRYTQPPNTFWEMYEAYLDDEEEVDPKAGGGNEMSIGEMCEQLLTKLEWYGTLFPRIPVPIMKEIEARLKRHKDQRRGPEWDNGDDADADRRLPDRRGSVEREEKLREGGPSEGNRSRSGSRDQFGRKKRKPADRSPSEPRRSSRGRHDEKTGRSGSLKRDDRNGSRRRDDRDGRRNRDEQDGSRRDDRDGNRRSRDDKDGSGRKRDDRSSSKRRRDDRDRSRNRDNRDRSRRRRDDRNGSQRRDDRGSSKRRREDRDGGRKRSDDRGSSKRSRDGRDDSRRNRDEQDDIRKRRDERDGSRKRDDRDRSRRRDERDSSRERRMDERKEREDRTSEKRDTSLEKIKSENSVNRSSESRKISRKRRKSEKDTDAELIDHSKSEKDVRGVDNGHESSDHKELGHKDKKKKKKKHRHHHKSKSAHKAVSGSDEGEIKDGDEGEIKDGDESVLC